MDAGKILGMFYEQNSTWDVVKKYLDEGVFALIDIDAETDGGNFEAR
jgi:hypothetical protein